MQRALAHLFVLALVAPLTGCPAHEGPIDVILVDIDPDDAEIEWAKDGGSITPCENAATDPEAVVGCGPYGVGDPGTYTIRVSWEGVVVDKEVTIEKDGDYKANASVTFDASEFGVTDGDSGR
jgi:hypothetical protein